MNTKLLEYMIVTAEEKGQSRAADRLMITQSALSQQIKKVEKELGTPVFRKEKNELLLTEAGRLYINGAKAALAIYGNALNDIRKISRKRKTQITLVYNNSLLEGIKDLITEFIETHHGIYVSTIYGNASEAKAYLQNDLADIAIMATGELNNSLLDFIPLRDNEIQLALPFGHPCVRSFRKNGIDYDQLKDEFFILNQEGSYLYQYSREIFTEHQFSPKSYCEIADLKSVRSMVMNRKGIAFLPKTLYREGTYAAISLDPPAVFHIAAAVRKSVELTPSVRDFIMLLLKKYDRTDRPD